MPTNTDGGTTTSLDNTPQAVDDSYGAVEDYSYLWDVMANDLGGKAKILWSIDTTSGDGSGDLVVKDAEYVPDQSELGATISIVDGKIRYDASPLDFLAAGETAEDHFTYAIRLSNGTLSWATVTIYLVGTNDGVTIIPADTVAAGTVVEDSAGTPSLTDSNVASGSIAFTDPDLIDTHSASFAAAAGNTTSLGTFALGAVSEAPDTAGGSVGWTYTIDEAAAQYLAEGESVIEVYTVTIDDGHGSTVTQDVTITITGTNDGPVISVEALDSDAAGVAETDSELTASGTLTLTDIDASDVVDVTVAGVVTGGTGGVGSLTEADLLAMLSLSGNVDNAADGTPGSLGWSFDSNGEAFDYLAAGETLILTYTLEADDGHGGTDSQDVTITITGSNDGPDISVGALDSDAAGVTETDAELTASGSLTVTDVDTSDVVDVTVTGVATGGTGGTGSLSETDLLDMLSLSGHVGNAADGTAGSLGWSFDSNGEAFDYLAAGETLILTYTLEADDGHGGTDSQDVTITITGSNDAPVLSVEATGSLTEDAADPTLSDSGTLSFTDADATDTHVVSSASTGVTWSGGPLSAAQQAALAAGFSAGAAGWTYSIANAAVQFLAAGETITLTFDVTVTDDSGALNASDTEAVTITITGTNDQPTLTISDAAGELSEGDGAPLLSDSGSLIFDDLDATDLVTVSATYNGDIAWSAGSLDPLVAAALVAGFSVDQDSWDFSASEDLDFLGAGETISFSFDVVATDDSGAGNAASAPQTVTITITGTNDAPVITGDLVASVDEGGSYVLTAADLGFSDPDDTDATFSVTGLSHGTLLVNGIAAASFTAAELAAGLVSFVHDGSETASAGFNVTVEDGDEDGSAPVPQAFSFTVNPVNDAPVNGVPGAQSVDEDTALVFSVANGNAITVADVDAGGNPIEVTLSVDDGTLVLASLAGITITGGADGSSTVTIQGTVAAINAALDGLAYTGDLNFNGSDSLSIVTSDLGSSGAGGALGDSDSVPITVDPVADPAVIAGTDTGSVTEDDAVDTVGGALTVDDPDAGEEAFNEQTNVAGVYGSFSVDAAGNWTYTLDNDDPDLDNLDTGESDFETFTVTSADGTTHDVVVEVHGADDIVDVLAPTDIVFSLATTTASFTTGLTVGATLGSFTAIDGDSSTWDFALSGPNASLFSLSATSGGSVSLVVAGVSDPSGPQPIPTGNYSFTVTVTDPGGNVYFETYTLSVGSSNGGTGDTTAAFTITAGTDIDFGLNGPDAINGGTGDDALVGGNQADSLFGGLGNDQLIGGAQNDNFVFNTALNASTNVDQLLDFNASGDRIQLDDAIFGAVGATLDASEFRANAGGTAADGNDFVLFDTTTGNLYYDPDGNGAADRILFAQLTLTGGALDAGDFSII